MGGRCGSTIFVLAILLCEVPDASRGTGEHHRHAPHARGNRAMVASLGLAKINWVPCPAVGAMGVPIRGVAGTESWGLGVVNPIKIMILGSFQIR